MATKVKIEDYLSSGEKITIIVEGPNISREKLIHLLDMIKLLGGFTEENNIKSIKDAIWSFILENFGDGTWFSLKDIYNVVSKRMNVKLTSLSTYLHRFVTEGKLEKKGSRPYTRYRVVKVAEEVI